MKVTIFTINSCGFCAQEKEYLQAKGIAFEEKNIELHREYLSEMLEKSDKFAGVPFTMVEKDDGTVVKLKGFTKEDFDNVFGQAPVVAPAATMEASVQAPPEVVSVSPPAEATPPVAPIVPEVPKVEELVAPPVVPEVPKVETPQETPAVSLPETPKEEPLKEPLASSPLTPVSSVEVTAPPVEEPKDTLPIVPAPTTPVDISTAQPAAEAPIASPPSADLQGVLDTLEKMSKGQEAPTPVVPPVVPVTPVPSTTTLPSVPDFPK